ncbi:M24 family metallopeptidase [Infirmifilum sp. SLHALR2]|nr:MAG: hypothetical protein B7L53_06930 [Thermofilum sp. NZ13]
MEPFKNHVERLLRVLTNRGLQAALIYSSPNIFYFTGTDAPSVSIILENGEVLLVASRLEYLRAVEERAVGDVYAFSSQEEVAEYERVVERDLYGAVKKLLGSIPPEKVGIAGASPDVKKRLAEKLGAEPLDITREVLNLRRQKDSAEISRIRESIRVAELAMRKALDTLDKGVREVDIAVEVLSLILKSGAQPSFDPIIAFGDHAAQPHAKPTQRELREGDVVKIDLGAKVNGYCSDMTRSVIFGKPSQKQERVFRAVIKALEKSIESLQAGKAAKEVYSAAFKALKEEGLHIYFNHGLGHGVGIEIHEEPYLNSENESPLLVGDIVTIEPGVYMAGYLGVRIEDMLYVREDGAELLTYFPRDYLVM